jgi:CRISPR/Cas system-associated exonuclease Cas4 (RecB family)
MAASRRALRASEVGEYVFCHRAWWLRHIKGYESSNTRQLEQGTAAHARHGRLVSLSGVLRALALLLFAAAALLALAALFPR